jgi:hypothetical protein
VQPGRLVSLGSLVSAAVVVAAACAPIFGIAQRSNGPTWCEEDAQATSNGYCDDFDYVTNATTMQEFPAVVNGSLAVTDAEANSAPNSFLVQSFAVSAEAGITVGNLVSFGGMPMPSGLPAFECQVDVAVSDLLALGEAGASVGFVGVGGQLPASEQPEVVVVSLGPDSTVSYSLERFPDPKKGPVEVGSCPGKTQSIASLLNGRDWVTFKLFFANEDMFDGGPSLSAACPLSADAGRVEEGGTHYIVLPRLGLFDLPVVRLAESHFGDVPYFVYGLLLNKGGGAPAVSLHFDNARCTAKPPDQ